MAQTYTLEEAADKLNLSIEEFKRRLRTEWTQVRSFRDGATLRFRANEIEELARSIGLGSSEELPLADSSMELPSAIGLADDSGEAAPAPKTPPPAKKADATQHDAPLKLDDSDEMFLITPDEPSKGSSSKKIKTKSDSDVRIEKATKRAAAPGEDEESILTEEFDVQGGSGKLSGKSGKLSASKLKGGDSGKAKTGSDSATRKGDSSSSSASKKAAAKAMEDSSSEFELSLEADSDEFELSLAPDSSEEASLGDMPAQQPAKSGQSGINLNRPADSGISLEKKKSDDDEIDFELSLETPGSGASSKKLGSGRKLEADSDSEFELTLEEPSDLSSGGSGKVDAAKKGDIFEATDFEIPALEDDSASEAVSLDEADTDLESSDFDLALDEGDVAAEDESASEVVAIDEEEVASARAKSKKRRKAADDEDEGEVDLSDVEDDDDRSVGAALAGVRRDDDDEEYEVSEAVDESGRPVAVAAPAKWGPLPAILMAPTILIMFLGGLMAYETLHSAWAYQQNNKPTTPLIDWVATTFDMKPQ